jgi:hypothetical protein
VATIATPTQDIQPQEMQTQLVFKAAQSPAPSMPIWFQCLWAIVVALDLAGSLACLALFGLIAFLIMPSGLFLILYCLLIIVSIGLSLAAPCARNKITSAVFLQAGIAMVVGHILIGALILFIRPMHGGGSRFFGDVWPVSLLVFGLAVLRLIQIALRSTVKTTIVVFKNSRLKNSRLQQ